MYKKNLNINHSNYFLEFFKSKYSGNGLLVYHKIGAGKTCTAIAVAESVNIIVLLPASLIGNFRDELRSGCAFNEYISEEDKEIIKNISPKKKQYKDIIKKSNKKINRYKIYSYHKIVDLVSKKKIKLKNTLLIIDEIQNMVSEDGLFAKFKKVIDKSDSKTKIILLSATCYLILHLKSH